MGEGHREGRPVMRVLVALIAGLALVAGCGDDGPLGDPSETTGARAQTPTQTEGQTPTPTSSADSGSVELVYISDSSGWETGEAYAELAEQELGVPVELIDLRVGSLQMTEVIPLVESVEAVIAEAEIIVLWANPTDSGVKEGIDRCHLVDEYGDPGVYTVADWRPFTELTGEVLDAVWALRDGRPTVVRVTDLYAPVVADWEEHGIRDACMSSFETMSDALEAAAEEHGAVFVSALDVYNGPDHLQDPVAEGLISYDGIHPGEAGGRAMAEALAATGFEPTPAP
jgi:predicted small lipoprotein YifL